MHREIQRLTAGDRGVQGLTRAYCGTKGMCTGDSGLQGVQGMSIGAVRGA